MFFRVFLQRAWITRTIAERYNVCTTFNSTFRQHWLTYYYYYYYYYYILVSFSKIIRVKGMTYRNVTWRETS